ncbi:serine/threonine protein kinase [Myxococcota bacterium]|nr:serine/threonine protein kinase [Myxococcota bacterium]
MSEKFGGYTLLKQIGVGGMAEIFLARHSGVEGFEKDIVIKRIRPHLSAEQSFVNMFLGEAKLAAQLNHPNIIQIYDLGKIKESYFIAMEYIAGRDMSQVIPKAREKGIPFPVEYALKIASNVCEALHYAHSQHDSFGNPLAVVHRDISPENIRLAWTGTVKILDFGIAKAATTLHETKAGEIKGKLVYMSPEQVLGKSLDHRSDIFSLGVSLYEFLTGMRMFSGDTDLSIMNNIIEGKVYPPSYFRDDVPEDVEAIVMKALEKDRRKRYQSSLDMQMDIDAFLAGHEFTPSNIHLANFVKQLFSDELNEEVKGKFETPTRLSSGHIEELKSANPKEVQNRLASSPFSTPQDFPDDLTPVRSQAPPPYDPEEIMLESDVLEEEDCMPSILVPLDERELDLLNSMAQSRDTTPEAIVHDMVRNFLKFSI